MSIQSILEIIYPVKYFYKLRWKKIEYRKSVIPWDDKTMKVIHRASATPSNGTNYEFENACEKFILKKQNVPTEPSGTSLPILPTVPDEKSYNKPNDYSEFWRKIKFSEPVDSKVMSVFVEKLQNKNISYVVSLTETERSAFFKKIIDQGEEFFKTTMFEPIVAKFLLQS